MAYGILPPPPEEAEPSQFGGTPVDVAAPEPSQFGGTPVDVAAPQAAPAAAGPQGSAFGGTPVELAAPESAHAGTPADGPKFSYGLATTFGLNPDGTTDRQDNGQGAPRLGRINTRDKNLIGVAIPEATLRAQLGDNPAAWRRARVEVVNAAGQRITAPIVDLGPGKSTGNDIDLTYAATQALGTGGKARVGYRILPDAGEDLMADPSANGLVHPFREFGATLAEDASSTAAGALRAMDGLNLPSEVNGVTAVEQNARTTATREELAALRRQWMHAPGEEEKSAINAVIAQKEAELREAVGAPDGYSGNQKAFDGSGPLRQAADAAQQFAEDARSNYGLPAQPGQAWPDQIARGAAHVTAMVPTLYAGLPAAAAQGAAQAYESGYLRGKKNAVAQGVTDPAQIEEIAHKAGSKAAVETSPGLALYLIGGKLATTAVAKIFEAPLTRGASGFVAGTAANVAVGGLMRSREGEPFMPSVEQFTQDATLGAFHGGGEYATARAQSPRVPGVGLADVKLGPEFTPPPEDPAAAAGDAPPEPSQFGGTPVDEPAPQPAAPAPFTPSTEWQEIPTGTAVPPGGEFRMDMASGKNYARWDNPPPADHRDSAAAAERFAAADGKRIQNEAAAAQAPGVQEGAASTRPFKGDPRAAGKGEADAQVPGADPDGLRLRQGLNRANEAGSVPLSLIQDAADFGAKVYRAGMTFARWSAEMLRQLGDAVKPHLVRLWERMQSERGSVGGGGGLDLKGERTDTPEKRRKFIQSVKDSAAVQPGVKDIAESVYEPITNKATVEAANARINELGIDAALKEVMDSDAKTSPPTARTYAQGIELMGRLQKSGRTEDAARLAEHIAENSTTQGQAIQALSLLSKLTPQGIEIYAARTADKATRANPETQRLKDELDRLRAELEKARASHATKAIHGQSKALDPGKGTAADKTALNLTLRNILAGGGDPADVRERMKQAIKAAGKGEAEAGNLADKLHADFQQHAADARASVLKQMLRVTKPGDRVPKSHLPRLTELNNAGALDDAQLHTALAEKLGVPTWTPELSRRVQKLQAEYEAAKDPAIKLIKGADMLDAVHSMLPVGTWEKVRSLQQIAMLLNVKTVAKIGLSHAAQAVFDTFVDGVNAYAVDPLASVVTGRRSTTTAAMGERFHGLTAPIRDFKLGYGYAKEQGNPHPFREGVQTMLKLAKLVNGGIMDPTQIKTIHTNVFSSHFMRMFEDATAFGHGVPYRSFHQAAYLSALADELATARRNGEGTVAPTPEMMERAMLRASRAIFMDKNFVSDALKNIQSAMNFGKPFGLGSLRIPFTQVPGALIYRAGEQTPLGFIKAAYEYYKPGVTPVERQRNVIDSFTRALAGSGVIATGYWLGKLGILSTAREEDKDVEAMREANGLGAYRVNVSAFKRSLLSGNWHTPQKDLPGDELVSYGWLEPGAIAVAMGAQFAHEEAKAARDLRRGKLAQMPANMALAMLGGAKALEEQPLLSGLAKLGRDIGEQQDYTHGVIGSIFKTVLDAPGNFVPTVVSQARQWQDDTVRETRGGDFMEQEINKAIAKLPVIASNRFPPSYDAFGQAKERYGYPEHTFFNVFVNPALISHVKADPAAADVLRVFAATGNAAAVPKVVQRNVTIHVAGADGQLKPQKLELTNQQIADYQKFTGTMTHRAFLRLAASPAFARIPDEAKAMIMSKVIGAAGTAAKVAILHDNPSRR